MRCNQKQELQGYAAEDHFIDFWDYEVMSPAALDENPSKYSELERASFALALQPLEIQPNIYAGVRPRFLSSIWGRTRETFSVLSKIALPPATQIVWLTIDADTRKRLIEKDKDPDAFLRQRRLQISQFFSFVEDGEIKKLNVSFVDSKVPPKGSYATVVFTDNVEATFKTRKGRIEAVREALYINKMDSRGVPYLKELEKMIADMTKKLPEGSSLDDIYDPVGQNPSFPKLVHLENVQGWTPMAGEDIGNVDKNNISFILVDKDYSETEENAYEDALHAAHELGHQFGLQHTLDSPRGEKAYTIMRATAILLDSVRGRESTKSIRDIAEQEFEKTYRNLREKDPKRYEPLYQELKKSALGSYQDKCRPDYFWGSQALTYLKFVLGLRK